MQSHCTIDDYHSITQTCHGVGGFTSVINPLHIYINRNKYFIIFKYLMESVICLLYPPFKQFINDDLLHEAHTILIALVIY